MKKRKTDTAVKEELGGFKNYAKKHYPIFILMAIGYLLVSAVNVFEVATSQTIMSFNLNDFEIGQISDRTLIAPKSISADEDFPFSIEEGDKIIRKGFPITSEAFNKLQKMAKSPNYIDWRLFANSELYLLVLLVMWFFIYAYVPFGRKIQLRELVFQCICFLIVYTAVVFGGKNRFFASPYSILVIIPATFVILIHAILYGQLSAVFFSFILSLGVLDASGWQIVPFLFTLSSCLAATAVVRNIEHRIDMIFVSLVMAFFNAVMIVLYMVVFNETFAHTSLIIAGVALNGFMSGILTLGLITPIELMLNTASVFRLMDLSDLNNPVMRKMLVTASGTYQHSQMVAQLAENACRDIGANSLLARVGAYYHDIGKMDQSEYFVENQSDGINKHDKMKPSLSASVIRSHVKKGVEKARQLHLPQSVIDIIEEHHGNSLIAYFYEEAKKIDPNVLESDYSYPGNPPSTKESAVVMLADTAEAACRTLENPTEERLDKFIKILIDSKIQHGQLNNCNLTFRDVTKIRQAFVTLLVGYYHNRIEYPDQKNPDSDSEKTKSEKTVEGKISKDAKTKTVEGKVVKTQKEKTSDGVKLHE